MPKRTCSVDGCEKPHLARGLCRRHYRFAHEMHGATCVTCGASFQGHRATAKYCSEDCRALDYMGPRVKCPLPADHPVRVEIVRQKLIERQAAREVRQPKRSDYAWRTARECRGCAAWFSPLYTPRMLDCSVRCARRVARRRRRAHEKGALGSWVWSDFMRIARKFGYCCAYCGVKPPRLDPDHVVPLSRGGYDSPANLLPACADCNGSKCDKLPDEWATDRAAKGLAPRVTTWEPEDARYHHLTQVMLAA